jgi:hypothetical protein
MMRLAEGILTTKRTKDTKINMFKLSYCYT